MTAGTIGWWIWALGADGFAGAVAGAAARYGAGRIAVVLGTSTSGVTAAEEAYRERAGGGALPGGFDYEHTQDLYSVAGYVRTALGLRGPALVISTACASSARCFLDAAQMMRAGVCDAAVVGGADSLCRMTLHGFAALELLSPGPTRPGAADRAGNIDWGSGGAGAAGAGGGGDAVAGRGGEQRRVSHVVAASGGGGGGAGHGGGAGGGGVGGGGGGLD